MTTTRSRGRILAGQAGEARAAVTGGMSLTLPYVPGRLVIEVSGPAGNAGRWRAAVMAASGARPARAGPGRLAAGGRK